VYDTTKRATNNSKEYTDTIRERMTISAVIYGWEKWMMRGSGKQTTKAAETGSWDMFRG
jgi:hypothetical protein